MRTEKELAYITQDLLDWMSEEEEQNGCVPTEEEMSVWLAKNYDTVLDNETLKELRATFL